MPSSPDSPLPYMLAFHHWSTLELIAFCEQQPPALLESSRPGVYGTIPETLAHMAASERMFLAAVMEADPADVPAARDGMPLSETAALVRGLAGAWQAYAANPLPAATYRYDPRGTIRIETILSLIFGMKHHTREKLQVEMDTFIDLGAVYNQTTIESPIVGAPNWEMFKRQGRIDPDFPLEHIHG